MGGNWVGSTAGWSVSNNQLSTNANDGIFWNSTYSGDVFAEIAFGSALPAGKTVALFLRGLNSAFTNGVIEVDYTQGTGIKVFTTADGVTWAQQGSAIAASFVAGDVFKAVAKASGVLEVYKNGTLIGSASTIGWAGYARAGQVGLWTDQSGVLLDNFNGGVGSGAGSVPGASKVLARPQRQPPPPVVTVTKYYYFGGQRVAMRKNGAVTWLHSDHLGSASLATDASGMKVQNSEQRYTPFGTARLNASGLNSKFTYTGQRDFTEFGMMDYGARMYLPGLGRFMSPDSIIPRPNDPQSLNRFAYVRNNPMSRVDPSGHSDCEYDYETKSTRCSPKSPTVQTKPVKITLPGNAKLLTKPPWIDRNNYRMYEFSGYTQGYYKASAEVMKQSKSAGLAQGEGFFEGGYKSSATCFSGNCPPSQASGETNTKLNFTLAGWGVQVQRDQDDAVSGQLVGQVGPVGLELSGSAAEMSLGPAALGIESKSTIAVAINEGRAAALEKQGINIDALMASYVERDYGRGFTQSLVIRNFHMPTHEWMCNCTMKKY